MGLTIAQTDLKRRITAATNKSLGFRYQCVDWNKHLWQWNTDKIYEYIEERFRITESIEEYYGCMILLRNHLNSSELLVEWSESKNRKRTTDSYMSDDARTSNDLKGKKTSNRSKQNATEIDSVEANGIKIVMPIQFIGDKK